MPRRYETIVFDLDGTLVDSAPEVASIIQSMLLERGIPSIAVDSIRRWSSIGGTEMISQAFSCNLEEASVLLSEFRDRYFMRTTNPESLYPRVMETLLQLHEQGFRLAVCTNKPQRLAAKVLHELHLAPMFAAVVCGDTLSRKKPHGDPIIRAIELSGGDVRSSLMVGDSSIDQKAAHDAGVRFCFYSSGYDDGVQINKADMVVKEIAELTEALISYTNEPRPLIL